MIWILPMRCFVPAGGYMLDIEARYPSYKHAIGESLSAEKCQEILSKTKEVQQWVKEML